MISMSFCKHLLAKSGLCIDRVRLLDWINDRDWARVLACRYLRLRFSPDILKNASETEVSHEERGRLFTLGMSFLTVGNTYKTTGDGRTRLADEAVLRHAVRMNRPALLEVGVSDGSSARNLLRNGGAFSGIILTDKYCHFFEKQVGPCRIFLGPEGKLLGVKCLFLYLSFDTAKQCDSKGYKRIETINPSIRREHNVESVRFFDMFTDVLEESVAIIKCANILNVSYFGEHSLKEAISNLSRSLQDGGVLVVSQNNEKYTDGEAFFVLRKDEGALKVVESVNAHDAVSFFEA